MDTPSLINDPPQIQAAREHHTLRRLRGQEANAKQFLTPARNYIVPDALTAAMLYALVDKIIVHAPDKSTGHRRQQIDICYNFVGTFDLYHETATRKTAMTAAGTKETA